MSLQDLVDFSNKANSDMGRYRLDFWLVPTPNGLRRPSFSIPTLTWSVIDYGGSGLEVPDDKRGIYAFVADVTPSATLPPHGYVLYIGIAGRRSSRSLRARYKDYLNERQVLKRPHIANMIGNWGEVLKFYFAPIDKGITSAELERVELELNSSLMPPFSRGDIEGKVKTLRKAFP